MDLILLEKKPLNKLGQYKQSADEQLANLGKQILENTDTDALVKEALENAIKNAETEVLEITNTKFNEYTESINGKVDGLYSNLESKTAELSSTIAKVSSDANSGIASLSGALGVVTANVASNTENLKLTQDNTLELARAINNNAEVVIDIQTQLG